MRSACHSHTTYSTHVYGAHIRPVRAWCVVLGAWCTVRGAWCTVHGAWCMHARCVVRGAWCVVRGAWCTVHGARCTVHGAQCTVHGARCMVHGAWCMWKEGRKGTHALALEAHTQLRSLLTDPHASLPSWLTYSAMHLYYVPFTTYLLLRTFYYVPFTTYLLLCTFASSLTHRGTSCTWVMVVLTFLSHSLRGV